MGVLVLGRDSLLRSKRFVEDIVNAYSAVKENVLNEKDVFITFINYSAKRTLPSGVTFTLISLSSMQQVSHSTI